MTLTRDGEPGRRDAAYGRDAGFTGRRLRTASRRFVVCAVLTVCTVAGPAAAQDAGQPPSGDAMQPPPAAPPQPVVRTVEAMPGGGTSTGEKLNATVSLSSASAEEIRLVKERSAVIRTSVPIARASISNPQIADVPVVTPNEVVVSALNYGSTQLILWTSDGQRKTYDVWVEIDVPMLNHAIKRLSPMARVEARMLAGTLVLSGRAPDSVTAERIETIARVVHNRVVNHIDIGGLQQALLRCTVAEVNREAIRQLAFNWAIGSSDWSRDFFFANNLGQLNPTNFGDNGLANILAPGPLGQLTYNRLATGTSQNVNVSFGFPRAEFQVFMQALRDNNLFRILAEPNVVAINGQEASFLSGGEFPIAVAQGGAVAGAISVEYKKFGIQLTFTPTILDSDVVRMKVVAEVSDLVPGTGGLAGGLPTFSLSSRKVDSTVEVGSGQTFAIGGLLSDRVQALSSRIPGLGDVPVLGALFASVRYQRNETELVVLVTPELVLPMDPHQVPDVPGGEMTEPDDYQLFALGQIEGTPHPRPEPDGAPRNPFPPRVRPTPAPHGGDGTDMQLKGPVGSSDMEER